MVELSTHTLCSYCVPMNESAKAIAFVGSRFESAMIPTPTPHPSSSIASGGSLNISRTISA